MLSARERLNLRREELGHVAKKALGQNFLVSDHVIDKIIQAVRAIEPGSIIEIGPGLGAITDFLILLGVDYQAIELDPALYEYWVRKGLNVVNEDALRSDWASFAADTLVSNLPYQISSSLVIQKSIEPLRLKSMVLMFQKEVAQRIRAVCKTEAYGMLSVVAQEFWKIELVCEAGPKDFSPPPKIASRVLKFTAKASLIADRQGYLTFVKMCFQQRRRILKSNVNARYVPGLLEWIGVQGLSEKLRAEELSPEQFKNLYLFFQKDEKLIS